MPYDEKLADRVRKRLAGHPGIIEKKMFGGIAFLLNGSMCVGVHRDALIVRLAPEDTGAALKRVHTRAFDLTGRPMKGWILVDPAGLAKASQLGDWIDSAVAFAGSLPPKT